MWLLKTSTFELEEFFDSSLPPYAILSHTWDIPSQEVSFVELQSANLNGRPIEKTGFTKISQFCRLAIERGYDYG
ncbi:hypothetical protein B0T16DRAFT_417163 [Cercophora newfieldiana]|uniref:Uncharacterized protein n=1 Tax=Cercophora newfieldiana TaxID=92897 RepID=A0AA39Y169_9PEZI|nr:hypothetical protein B0T16DRAFT_417163 [Cercophora newfieldiana]